MQVRLETKDEEWHLLDAILSYVRILQKLTKSPYNPATALLGIYPTEKKN